MKTDSQGTPFQLHEQRRRFLSKSLKSLIIQEEILLIANPLTLPCNVSININKDIAQFWTGDHLTIIQATGSNMVMVMTSLGETILNSALENTMFLAVWLNNILHLDVTVT
jgi:hypothetical protein